MVAEEQDAEDLDAVGGEGWAHPYMKDEKAEEQEGESGGEQERDVVAGGAQEQGAHLLGGAVDAEG